MRFALENDAADFLRVYWRTRIVPDVFQKRVLPSTARFEFLWRENRVVDFAPELALKPSDGLC